MTWECRRSHWVKQIEDARAPFDVDYARVVHSASFRRLQGKTQILNLGEGDFYRTRLTHSLETAQIATGITRRFAVHFADHPAQASLPPTSLIQAISFSHDLGHPPFGHGGETALNYCMRENGGFEGNGQTLRILSRLEIFSEAHGADLTRRALLGVLKYPAPYSIVQNRALRPCLEQGPTLITVIDQRRSKPPKCFFDSERDVVDWILEPSTADDRALLQQVEGSATHHHTARHKSFDCSIMDVADDIAYGVHDLEDAVALGLVSDRTFGTFVSADQCQAFLESIATKYPDQFGADVHGHFIAQLFGDSIARKRSIGRLAHYFVSAVTIDTEDAFTGPLLRYRAAMDSEARRFLERLQRFIFEDVISSPKVQHLTFKGQKMVALVFEAMQSDPKRFLPTDAYRRYEASPGGLRVLCDYVSGMTDGFLLKTYDRLFSPRMGSVFDKL